MPKLSAPTALDKYILNKNPNTRVKTEKPVSIATALNKCFKPFSPHISTFRVLLTYINYIAPNLLLKLQIIYDIKDFAVLWGKMESIIYKIKENDTLESLSKKFGVPKSNFSTQTFETGDRVVISLKVSKTYIVMPGDNIQKISAKLGITEAELLKKLDGTTIFVGKHIVI